MFKINDRPTVSKRIDPTMQIESPSMSVVEAVAQQSGVDATELPPLHDVVDPDALDALFRSTGRNPERDVQVSFDYDRYTVTISGATDGDVDVTVEAL